MKRTAGLWFLLTACSATFPPHRGSGPAPIGPQDRAVERLSALSIEWHRGLDHERDPLIAGRRVIDLPPPQNERDRRALERVSRLLAAGLATIDASKCSPPYQLDRALLERIQERDRRLALLGPGAPILAALALYAPSTSTTSLALGLADPSTDLVATATRALLTPEQALAMARAAPEETLFRQGYAARGLLDALEDLAASRGRALAALAALDVALVTSELPAEPEAWLSHEADLPLEEARARWVKIRAEPGRATAAYLAGNALLGRLLQGCSWAQILAQGIVPPSLTEGRCSPIVSSSVAKERAPGSSP